AEVGARENGVVEGDGKLRSRYIPNAVSHTHDVIHFLADDVRLDFGIAGVQDDALELVLEVVEELGQRLGLGQMRPALIVLKTQPGMAPTVTAKVDDGGLVIEERPAKVVNRNGLVGLDLPLLAVPGAVAGLLDLFDFTVQAQAILILRACGQEQDSRHSLPRSLFTTAVGRPSPI